MLYFYILAGVLTSGLSGYFYKHVSLAGRNAAASLLSPIMWYLPLSLLFGIIALAEGAGRSAAAGLIPPALLSGLGAAICAVMLLEGMKHNAYAASVIIINLNFILPVLLSMIFLREKTGWAQLIGMLAAAVAIIVVNSGGSKATGTDAKRPYILLAVAGCVGNGILNFGIKLKEHGGVHGGDGTVYALTYLFACLLCLSGYAVYRITGRPQPQADIRRALPYAAGIGVCNGICFWAIGALARYMNAAAEFTVITALSIAVSLTVGRVFLRERIGLRGILSLLGCAVAIVCQYWNLH